MMKEKHIFYKVLERLDEANIHYRVIAIDLKR
jgi:hypothetical protein